MWCKKCNRKHAILAWFSIFQHFHHELCFSWNSYPWISHLKSNSVPDELQSKLVTSGKWNIWSCNHNCVRKQLQVLAVLPPLVFISVRNCSDMYLLFHILRKSSHRYVFVMRSSSYAGWLPEHCYILIAMQLLKELFICQLSTLYEIPISIWISSSL